MVCILLRLHQARLSGRYSSKTNIDFYKIQRIKDTHNAIGKESKKELMTSPDFCNQSQLSVFTGGR